ncbi:hypothetical protein BDV93DRAFT_561718 [Ceratobasidium sp. AG-I]|nr:hypothetical protein BDV93DRAFT_561718 [Ceratobasidium sp. AG-I]
MPNLTVLELDQALTDEEDEADQDVVAAMVPALRSVHIEQGILFMVGRDNPGTFRSAGGIGCLDDADVGATGMSFMHIKRGWKRQPNSKVAEELYKSWAYANNFVRHYEPDPERDSEPCRLFL